MLTCFTHSLVVKLRSKFKVFILARHVRKVLNQLNFHFKNQAKVTYKVITNSLLKPLKSSFKESKFIQVSFNITNLIVEPILQA